MLRSQYEDLLASVIECKKYNQIMCEVNKTNIKFLRPIWPHIRLSHNWIQPMNKQYLSITDICNVLSDNCLYTHEL